MDQGNRNIQRPIQDDSVSDEGDFEGFDPREIKVSDPHDDTVTDSGNEFRPGMVSFANPPDSNSVKEMLDDISDICKTDNAGSNVGQAVLCEIRNTMSDRTATETLFHKLLQAYRE